MASLFLFEAASPTPARSHSRSSSASSTGTPGRRPPPSANTAFFSSSFPSAFPASSSRPISPPPRRPLFGRRSSSGSPSNPYFPSPPVPTDSGNGFLFMGGDPGSAGGARRRRGSAGSDKGKERASLDWGEREDAILEEDEEKAASRPTSKEDLRAAASGVDGLEAARGLLWAGEERQSRPSWRSSRPPPLGSRPKTYPASPASCASPPLEDRLDRLLEGFHASIPACTPGIGGVSPDPDDADPPPPPPGEEDEAMPPPRYQPMHRSSGATAAAAAWPPALRVASRDASSSRSRERPGHVRRGSSASARGCGCRPCALAAALASAAKPGLLCLKRRGSSSSGSSAWPSGNDSEDGGEDGVGGKEEEDTTAQTSPAWSVEGRSLEVLAEKAELEDDGEGAEGATQAEAEGDEAQIGARVRFCEGQVEEVVTWSSRSYNRKGPAPVAKLTMRDVLELKEVKEELGVATGLWGIGIGPRVGVGVGAGVGVGLGVGLEGVEGAGVEVVVQ